MEFIIYSTFPSGSCSSGTSWGTLTGHWHGSVIVTDGRMTILVAFIFILVLEIPYHIISHSIILCIFSTFCFIHLFVVFDAW